MSELFFLTLKEKQRIFDILFDIYGFENISFFDSYDILFKIKDDCEKIYLLSKEISEAPLENFRIDSLGMYFGELKFNEIRLSIEGSLLIGRYCSKNVYELNDEQFNQFILGNDLEVDDIKTGFYIIKHGDDYFGSSKIKNNNLNNFVPKERRVGAIIT